MFVRNKSKRLMQNLGIASFLVLICVMFSSTASAQAYNRKTTVTFSVPVEIPGVDAQVLPAGTYVFKLLDSQSDRHIVQMRFLEGLSLRQIARVLGQNHEHVRQRFHAALRSLERELEELR